MIRQDIRIADYRNSGESLTSYKYVVDLYKAGIDFKENVKKKYVMIRKYSITNGIVYDSDIYIIEKELLKTHPEYVAYPVTNRSYVGFSLNPSDFNSNFSTETFYNIEEDRFGDEIYNIYEKNGDEFAETDVPCDKIRIYHPNNKTSLTAVIYVDTMVRDTHFHLLCRPYGSYETDAESDFTLEHIMYSEFVECYIPSIEYLLSGKAFYTEYTQLVYGEGIDNLIYIKQPTTYVALKVFSLPFIIKKADDAKLPGVDAEQLIKYYLPNETGVVNGNYVTWPLRITISPYSYIDDTTYIYTNNGDFEMNSDMMQGDATMSLCASTGFDKDGNHVIKAVFDLPDNGKYDSFREAYEHYYNVNLNDYTGIVEYNEDDDIENEDDYVEQKQCGFVLRVYSDVAMKQKVGEFIYNIDNPAKQLNDFAFQTAGMFKQWEQLPNVLVFQCMFIDRWLGNIIRSNAVIITEETFKYFINNDTRSHVDWYSNQQVYDNIDNMDLTKLNFIDKISCTIKKANTEKDATSINRTARVLYKPLFYRTQDLQTIKLRTGVVQNIGINLSEYMTKVETFKLTIGGTQVVESARNDIYVIFNINPTVLADTTGTYNISNQDDEYISSGKYTVE